MSLSLWLWVAVVVASVWHPFRADGRTAANVAGLRLWGMLFFLLAFWFLPSLLFDPGSRDGTDTCPSFVVDHSQAWWAQVVLFGCVLWSGIGVLKAGGASVLHREGRVISVLAAGLTAVGFAAVGLILLALSNLCP